MGNLLATEITFNDGSVSTLEQFAGKVLLVVNVASECGFTQQYAGLQELHETYRDSGLEILGVPCNQFGGQEPGTDAEIAAFCSSTFAVSFPLTAKTDVNGENAHPLYRQLTAYPSGEVRDVKWNFEKFLVNRDGQIVGRFGSAVEPLSEELDAAVRAAL
ncbi:glutathione peroxidase [Paeniglutamicibacter cryotolerans]|uniref:Glutathione peroxidase n=1 Tax=Paeniglutamicibacter cryotolerans TaxID=670079 RepID=A0A839QPN5_9MICC|nr:glutathione peroxidase [Paeniglutamicibacter cryotolerans]MBB2995202.1 glutathione peroxidase [Paeniglutamicibacter cryotolerans]